MGFAGTDILEKKLPDAVDAVLFIESDLCTCARVCV